MKAVVVYSGGKDGHLALMRALEDGAEIAGLLYLDGGKKHFDFFHDGRKTALLRELARAQGYKFFTVKVPEFRESAVFLESLRDFISGKIPGAAAVYLGLTDASPEAKAMPERMAAIFRKRGLKCVFPVMGMSAEDVLGELMRKGGRMLITGVIGAGYYGWLGKIADAKFLRQAGRLRREGGDFQTLVLKSPVFRSELRVKGSRTVDTADEGRYLEILDWELR